MSPRPYLAMKFTASVVTLSAAMTRSPSFSRSSSSTTTSIRPARISSMAVSMDANAWPETSAGLVVMRLTSCAHRTREPQEGLTHLSRLEEPKEILADHVHFQVHPIPRPPPPERRDGERVGDHHDFKSIGVQDRHREAHPIHGHRAPGNHIAHEAGVRDLNPHPHGITFRGDAGHPPDAVHVAQDQVASQRRPETDGALEVHR